MLGGVGWPIMIKNSDIQLFHWSSTHCTHVVLLHLVTSWQMFYKEDVSVSTSAMIIWTFASTLTFPKSRWHISRPLSKIFQLGLSFSRCHPPPLGHLTSFSKHRVHHSKTVKPEFLPSKMLKIRMARVTLEKRTSLAPGFFKMELFEGLAGHWKKISSEVYVDLHKPSLFWVFAWQQTPATENFCPYGETWKHHVSRQAWSGPKYPNTLNGEGLEIVFR